jgi:hypothetical protein
MSIFDTTLTTITHTMTTHHTTTAITATNPKTSKNYNDFVGLNNKAL